MAIVKAPVEGYTGTTAGVDFKNGVGQATDTWVLGWLTAHGYQVESTQAEKAADEKAAADENATDEKAAADENATAAAAANVKAAADTAAKTAASDKAAKDAAKAAAKGGKK